jgi:hypothetical protein
VRVALPPHTLHNSVEQIACLLVIGEQSEHRLAESLGILVSGQALLCTHSRIMGVNRDLRNGARLHHGNDSNLVLNLVDLTVGDTADHFRMSISRMWETPGRGGTGRRNRWSRASRRRQTPSLCATQSRESARTSALCGRPVTLRFYAPMPTATGAIICSRSTNAPYEGKQNHGPTSRAMVSRR